MIDPLVIHPDGPGGIEVDGQTVLRQHVQTVGGDHLGNAVVDLRVDVVGPSGKDDAPSAPALHFLQHPFSFLPDVLLGPQLLRPGGADGGPGLPLRDVPLLLAQPHQPVGGSFFVRQCDEGPDVAHLAVGHGFHIVLQVLGVGHHNGAVIVVLGILCLLVLVEHAGMEDGLDPAADQPLHMAVGQLGGVALGFRGDGFHTQLVKLSVGQGGQRHPEAQLPEEGGPEGIVFVEVQHPGDADGATGGGFQGRVVEHALQLVGYHIGGGSLSAAAGSPLAPVAGDMALAAGEAADGEHTAVGAAPAPGGGGGIGQVQELLQREHPALLAPAAVPGNQRRAEGTHDAGNIRADGFDARDFLKGPEHRLVVEGAALDHHVPAQFLGIGQLDDLEQGVFDHGVGQARGNVRYGSALLLGLLHVGIHEHGAPGAQVHGILGKQRLLGKARGGIAQGFGEIFNKGAAAGGAGLVEHDGIHRSALQPDALHILAADVQHAVHVRVKEGGGGAVGNGLHLSLVQMEGGLQQGFAIAGGAGTTDSHPGVELVAEPFQGLLGGFYRVALIVGVVEEQQLALLADEGDLGGGGAGIDAQVAVALVIRQLLFLHHGPVVPGTEGPVLRFVREQGVKPLDFKGHLHTGVQGGHQVVNLLGLGVLCVQGSAQGGKEMGVFRLDGGFLRQLQGSDEGLFQLRQEVQGATQEGNPAPNGLAAGEAGNGLIHHRLKNGGSQVRPAGPLVDQGLDVRFGEHAAPGGDGVKLPVVGRFLVQTQGVGLKQGRHLVDEGAGAAGADTVHPLLQAAGEIDDLGILTSQLDGHIGLGSHLFQGGGHGHHLLHEGNVQSLAQIDAAGAGDFQPQRHVPQALLRFPEKLGQGLLGMGAVAAVFSEYGLAVLIQDHQLHRGGANINSGGKFFFFHFEPLSMSCKRCFQQIVNQWTRPL